MKGILLMVGLALLSMALVLGCGKPEEPAKAQKPRAQQQQEAPEQPVAEPKPAEEQKPTATQAASAHKEAEPKEHHAKGEHEKKELAKHDVKPQEPPKHEPHKPVPSKPDEKHGQKSDLDQALLAYLAKKGDDPKYADPRQVAQIDLNGDGHQDALVLLQNPMYFCGTGGCTLLVFKGTKAGFEFVSRSSLIRSPVLVSDTKTHGWRDLIVEVSGGGIAPKRVALKYTGSTYPLNPSTVPPVPKNKQLKGIKVF